MLLSFLLAGWILSLGTQVSVWAAADDDAEVMPPPKGKPGKRIGGGVRTGNRTFTGVISVLNPPDSTYLTDNPQPVLYWFLSKSTELDLHVSIQKVDKPLNEVVATGVVKGAKKAGIAAIGLADKSIFKSPASLEEGVAYVWNIRLALPDAGTSEHPFARGAIEYRKLSPEIAKQLEEAGPKRYAVFARNGYWFNALATITEQVDKQDSDPQVRKQRADLLMRAKLPVAGLYERLTLKPDDAEALKELLAELKIEAGGATKLEDVVELPQKK